MWQQHETLYNTVLDVNVTKMQLYVILIPNSLPNLKSSSCELFNINVVHMAVTNTN